MGLAVLADKPAAVDGEDHVQLLQRNVMLEHVVGALQKRRIDRYDRLHALLGKPGCHTDRMALGNAHIKKTLRVQPGPVLHGSRDGADGIVGGSRLAERLPECVRERRRGGRGRHAGIGVEPADAVEILRRLLRRRVALALFGNEMDDDRLLQ